MKMLVEERVSSITLDSALDQRRAAEQEMGRLKKLVDSEGAGMAGQSTLNTTLDQWWATEEEVERLKKRKEGMARQSKLDMALDHWQLRGAEEEVVRLKKLIF